VKADKEEITSTRIKFTVEVAFDELKPDFQTAYREIAKQVNIPGFRKGKVPPSIIDQRVGRAAVMEEVVNAAIPRYYTQLLKDHDLKPFAAPEVKLTELNDGKFIKFTIEVDVQPEFELPDLSSIEVEVDSVVVEDKFVEEQFDLLRRRFATMKVVERPAAADDLIILDAKGTVAGEESEDYSATALNYELGSGGLVPGADEALIGIAVDESRDIEFTPDDGPHKDKKVKVTFSCTGVREREMPEANDEFAQMASEFDTVTELKADLTERIRKVQVAEQAIAAREKVYEALIEKINLEIPENILAKDLDQHFADGHGDDAHREEYREGAIKTLKSGLILDKIADQENVQVNEMELSQWLVQSAPRYGLTPEQLADELVKNDSLGFALNEVRRGKALSVAVEKATVKTPDGEVVDLSEFTGALAQ
jgi:trigger factor